MLEIENVTIAYNGAPVVENLTVSFPERSFIGLIGPNGAGKTSLLLTIAGQFQPAAGRVQFKGSDIYHDNPAFKKQVGYVHENPFFYSYLTTGEFMHFVADVKQVSPEEAERQIPDLLKMANIWDERDKLTANLSMGMRKKLAIAAAMIGSPQILFLDEALNGVDFESAFRIKNALKEFVARGGTVILSTHVLEVIEKICQRYVVLKAGKIIADLAAERFKNESEYHLEDYIVTLLRGE